MKRFLYWSLPFTIFILHLILAAIILAVPDFMSSNEPIIISDIIPQFLHAIAVTFISLVMTLLIVFSHAGIILSYAYLIFIYTSKSKKNRIIATMIYGLIGVLFVILFGLGTENYGLPIIPVVTYMLPLSCIGLMLRKRLDVIRF